MLLSELTSDAFVHEGITTGLKGGRLILDDEDLDTMQESVNHHAVMQNNGQFQAAARMATAPIRLAVSDSLMIDLTSTSSHAD